VQPVSLVVVRIGVRELNRRTSQVLDRVRRGETVIPPRFKGPLPLAVPFGDPSIDAAEVVRELRDEA
jgi:hypothetical protein